MGGARQGRREGQYAGILARLRTPHRAAQRVPATQSFIVLEALSLDPDAVDGDAVDRARKLVEATLFEPGRLLAVPKSDDDAVRTMLRDRIADDLLRWVGLDVDVGRVGRRSLGHRFADGTRLGAC